MRVLVFCVSYHALQGAAAENVILLPTVSEWMIAFCDPIIIRALNTFYEYLNAYFGSYNTFKN